LHGDYLPPDLTWTMVGGSRHHHQVWLWRLQPGRQRRTRILLGEVRRHRMEGRATREWRSFAEGTLEFPPVFQNHYLAMDYLKRRWETRCLVPEALRPLPAGSDAPEWQAFVTSLLE
jgi:hypothetical protein